jgi:hypothetical protein
MNPKLRKAIMVFLLLIIIGATYGWYQYNRKAPSTADRVAAATVSAVQMADEFEKDENKANTAYRDKVLEIRGKLAKVQKDSASVSVQLLTNGMGLVNCELEKDQAEKANALKENDEITVKGVCNGYLLPDVIITRTVIVKP